MILLSSGSPSAALPVPMPPQRGVLAETTAVFGAVHLHFLAPIYSSPIARHVACCSSGLITRHQLLVALLGRLVPEYVPFALG